MQMYIRPFTINRAFDTSNGAIAATSTNLALPYSSIQGFGTPSVRVTNVGTATVFIKFVKTSGDIVTVNNGHPILSNTYQTFAVPNDCLYIAYIGSAANGNLYVTVGDSA